jgi:FkbM family methyltransferase
MRLEFAHRLLANKANEGRVRLGPLRGSTVTARDTSRPSYWIGSYERHVVREMRKLVQPGMISYDIGAHIGYMSLVLSKLVGSSGRVIAFEPDPDNVASINTNIRRNGISNIRVCPMAVADKSSEVHFATFGYSFVNHIAEENEPADARIILSTAVSLDDFVYAGENSPPDFVKIDVEGAEDRVFTGGERLFQAKRPIVIAEIRRDSFPRIEAFMRGQDYKYKMLYGGISDWDKNRLADIVFTPQPRRVISA